MKNINLKYIKNENNLQIIASNDERQIAKYLLFHNKILSQVSEELARATLISWSTIDLCFAEQINIEIDCTQASQKYIKKHYDYVTNTYGQRFKISNASLCFLEPVIEIASELIVLDSHKYFLGYSSGKDSTLCKWLLIAVSKNTFTTLHYNRNAHTNLLDRMPLYPGMLYQ